MRALFLPILLLLSMLILSRGVQAQESARPPQGSTPPKVTPEQQIHTLVRQVHWLTLKRAECEQVLADVWAQGDEFESQLKQLKDQNPPPAQTPPPNASGSTP